MLQAIERVGRNLVRVKRKVDDICFAAYCVLSQGSMEARVVLRWHGSDFIQQKFFRFLLFESDFLTQDKETSGAFCYGDN